MSINEPHELISETRQAELEVILKRGLEVPGIAEALKAYEELQQSLRWHIVLAQGEIRYATGGNSQ